MSSEVATCCTVYIVYINYYNYSDSWSVLKGVYTSEEVAKNLVCCLKARLSTEDHVVNYKRLDLDFDLNYNTLEEKHFNIDCYLEKYDDLSCVKSKFYNIVSKSFWEKIKEIL